MEENKLINDFFKNEIKSYSFEICQNRAIPSMIDGMKESMRKVLWTSQKLWKGKVDEKSMKVFQLTGRVSADTAYLHGDASLNGVITTSAQKFISSLPILLEDGQFGSIHSPEASSPRYISTRLSPMYQYVYKDPYLLEQKNVEGIDVEPEYFLPIIPTIFTTSGSGIAVGFACNILNRGVVDIIDTTIEYIKKKKITSDLVPVISGYKGTFTKDTNPDSKGMKWIIRGIYDISKGKNNTVIVNVKEFAHDVTYEKFESNLNDLKLEGTIKDWSSSKVGTDLEYHIEFPASKFIDDNTKLEKKLLLSSSETENITVIDENKKIRTYDKVNDLIKDFIDFRMNKYNDRKAYLINKLKDEIKLNTNRYKFVKMQSEKNIITKKSEDECNDILEKNKFDRIDGSYSYLLTMPITSITSTKIDHYKSLVEAKEAELKEVEGMDIKKMYLSDLTELKAAYEKLKKNL